MDDYRDFSRHDRRHSRAPIDPSPSFLLVLTGLTWGLIFWACMIGEAGGFQ